MPNSHFNGLKDQQNRTDFNSPKLFQKPFSHAKSSSLDPQSNRKDLPNIDADEQQTAMILPHLMLSKYLPKTTSLPVSSMTPSSNINSYREADVIKNVGENADIYEDPSEHYSILGRPPTTTSFQTSTPVRNTLSTSARNNIDHKVEHALTGNSIQSSSVLGSKNQEKLNIENASFRLGYGKNISTLE